MQNRAGDRKMRRRPPIFSRLYKASGPARWRRHLPHLRSGGAVLPKRIAFVFSIAPQWQLSSGREGLMRGWRRQR